MKLIWGTVTEAGVTEQGMQRLTVSLDEQGSGRAVCYPALSGECAVSDRIVLNTTAVELSLGTGGVHFVVARESDGHGVVLDDPSGGHIMKLRYTPLQRDVLSVESQESPHHAVMKTAAGLSGMPVVCCGLHSQLPLVAAAIKHANPALRVAYCMTDGAALALPFSDVVRASVASGLLDATVSCGQAFGGEYESVNLHSGLLAAQHVARADVAIVAIGPGVVGTATPFGHGGIAQGEALNAVYSLGGTPVAALRISFADARPRHRVVSHHTLAALTQIALGEALVAVPALPGELASQVDDALEHAGVWNRHRRVDASGERQSVPEMRGIRVTTMGRGIDDDPAFFSAAFAAGQVAAGIAGTRRT